MFRLCQLLVFVWFCRETVALLGFGGGNTWTYYFEGLETETSDENRMSFDLHYERIASGIYALSGSANVNYDFKEDTFVEALVYRSASGSSDYKQLPYSMPRQNYLSALNSFYKELVMQSFANCSNLPQFEDEFQPPFEKKVYELSKCQISNEKLPRHVPEGYYKVDLIVDGEVQWKIIVTFKLEPI